MTTNSRTLLPLALLIFAGCSGAPSRYDGRPDSLAEAYEQLMEQAWANWQTAGGLRQALDAVPAGEQVRVSVVDWDVQGVSVSAEELERELRHLVIGTDRCRYLTQREALALQATHFPVSEQGRIPASARAWSFLSNRPSSDSHITFRSQFDVAARATVRTRGDRLRIDIEIVHVEQNKHYAARGDVRL